MRSHETLEFTMADRFRKAREVAGLTQDDVAELMRQRGFKVSRSSTVSAWETGAQPRQMMRVVAALGELYDVPVQWLLTGELPLSRQCENRKLRVVA